MKPVRFHPDADSEMVDAAVWYESRQEDLGKRFLACSAIDSMRFGISSSTGM